MAQTKKMLIINQAHGNIKPILALLIIILCLIGIVVFKPGLDNKTTAVKITQLSDSEIESIEIISADQKSIHLFKRDFSWFITIDSEDIPADSTKVRNLLNIVNANSLEKFIASQNQLEKYRLLKPQITIKFDDLTIAFGSSEPINRRRYVMIDNTIHLISDLYYHLLLQPVETFVAKQKK